MDKIQKTITIPKAHEERIEKIAKSNGLSWSYMVRRMIEVMVENKSDKEIVDYLIKK